MSDARAWLESVAWATDDGVEAMRDALLAVLDMCEPTVQRYRHSRSGYDEGAMDFAGAIEAAIDRALGVES